MAITKAFKEEVQNNKSLDKPTLMLKNKYSLFVRTLPISIIKLQWTHDGHSIKFIANWKIPTGKNIHRKSILSSNGTI